MRGRAEILLLGFTLPVAVLGAAAILATVGTLTADGVTSHAGPLWLRLLLGAGAVLWWGAAGGLAASRELAGSRRRPAILLMVAAALLSLLAIWRVATRNPF